MVLLPAAIAEAREIGEPVVRHSGWPHAAPTLPRLPTGVDADVSNIATSSRALVTLAKDVRL